MCRSRGRATRTRLAVAAILVVLWHAGPARAAEPDGSNLSRAHDAYARGAAAYGAGDYARAARELAAADALVPDGVTLRAALDAVTLADDPVLGAELLARVERGPTDPPLAHAAAVAHARFAHRTGRLVVRCERCLAMVDGAPVEPDAVRVVLPGVHTVTVQRSGAPEPRLVTVAVDETREVVAGAPSVATVPDPRPEVAARAADEHGVSPAWFVAAASASVALGAVTIWSALDTASDHTGFVSAGCEVSAAPSCGSLARTGQGAQTRTAWLGAGTGVAVAGTVALGALAVRWHRSGGRDVAIGVAGATTTLRLTF